MRKLLFYPSITGLALSLALSGGAQAGPVGTALDAIGASAQAQNAGDALYNELTAWATKGEATRGASGAMAELVLNSGELICSSWIIGFRLRIRNMVIENHNMSGAEQSEHLQLIARTMRFADLLEQECYRVGLLGEPAADGTASVGSAGGEAPAPASLLLPGETVADAICRRRCQPFLDRLDEANRELAQEEERRRQAEEDFNRKAARAEELREEVRRLQQALDALPSGPATAASAGGAAARDEQLRRGHDLRRALTTAEDSLPQAEAAASAAQKQLALVTAIVADYRKAAQEAQAQYNDCLRNCLQQAAAAGDPTTTICPEPPAHKPVSIGPNDKVGSSARSAEQLKQSLGGSALGGLFGGGGGVTFGSKKANPVPNRVGASGNGEPKTVDDPVDADVKVAHTVGETELLVGAMMTGDGLLVSAFIEQAPGDGTFQAVFLEDADGRRRIPDRYDIYDLWREWKLTVWWTRDRWVNGQHVSHEEGGWTESGRDTTQLAVLRPSEAQEHGIWNRLGFSSAAKGVRGLGAQFAVTTEDLSRPIDLVIHTTLPKEDPVVTQPMIYRLSADAAASGGVALLPVANSLAVERGCY